MTSIRSYAQQNTIYLYTSLFCHLFDEYSLSTCFFWYWSTCSKYNCDPHAHKYMFSFVLYFTETNDKHEVYHEMMNTTDWNKQNQDTI